MSQTENDARRADLMAQLAALDAAPAPVTQPSAQLPPEAPADAPANYEGDVGVPGPDDEVQSPVAVNPDNEVITPFVPSVGEPTAPPAGPNFATLQEIEQALRSIARAVGITL